MCSSGETESRWGSEASREQATTKEQVPLGAKCSEIVAFIVQLNKPWIKLKLTLSGVSCMVGKQCINTAKGLVCLFVCCYFKKRNELFFSELWEIQTAFRER